MPDIAGYFEYIVKFFTDLFESIVNFIKELFGSNDD